jgi:hypothetical protein
MITVQAWADAIAALSGGDGRIPKRVVVVPREAVAHHLRRELVSTGRAHALVGTRFVRAIDLALERLAAAGRHVHGGEDELRAHRIEALLSSGALDDRLGPLATSRRRVTPGWGRALARTIFDLEHAACTPETLADHESPIVRDIATIWRAALDAADSPTQAQIFLAAAALPRIEPACLAVLGGDETEARLRFLRTLSAAHSIESPTIHGSSDLALLASYLFADPSVLRDPARRKNAEPDGTVEIEEHAGIDEELEAAADWIVRQVSAGVALEELGVFVAGPAATAARVVPLLVDRLTRLPWPATVTNPVVALGGISLRTAPHARSLAIVRALRAHLPVALVADLIPSLRAIDGPLSAAAASDVAYHLGTPGGDAARPRDALQWAERAIARDIELAAELAAERAHSTGADEAGGRRSAQLERRLARLATIRPALIALTDVARDHLAAASLSTLAPAITTFLAAWLDDPGEIPTLLTAALEPLARDRQLGALTGDAALSVIEDALVSLRASRGRAGDPGVHVGPLSAAAHLSFRAVRVIGLCEGALPGPPDEDPLLPDAQREPLGLPIAADRARRERAAFHLLVRDTRDAMALSAPRVALDRGARAVSSVIIDAEAALGRGGELAAAHTASRAFRHERPLSESAWQDLVAADGRLAPPWWHGAPETDLARLAGLANSPDDGVLGVSADALPLAGLTANRHISASRLRTLLSCPRRFLYESVLGWHEPDDPPPARVLEPRVFGDLVHRAAEDFFTAHGASFSSREGPLLGWQELARAYADRRLDEHLRAAPLVGAATRDEERRRVHREIDQLLEIDWHGGMPRRFVGVERSFGEPAPLPLPIGDGVTMWVRGYVDRLDVEDGTTLVRDLKTGRPHPRLGRETNPDPVLDVQIGLYGLVAEALAAEWNVPPRASVAYVYTGYPDRAERAFRNDFPLLATRTREWLRVAHDLLAARAFPHSPRAGDCDFCPFRAVCGEDAASPRATPPPAPPGSALAAFFAMKAVER